jgi:hypothetical protein
VHKKLIVNSTGIWTTFLLPCALFLEERNLKR